MVLLAAAAFVGCAQRPASRFVRPLSPAVDAGHIENATLPASFTADDFNWKDGRLSLTVFQEDLYDAVEVNALAAGDTLLWNQDTIIIREIEQDGEVKVFNKGMEEGGAELTANGGGTYRALLWDDHSAYTAIGQAALPLADDFLLIDCGEEPADPNDTLRTGQQAYLEALKDSRRQFNCLNTTVVVEKGRIASITRRWIP